jgi:hypothetical protein
MLAVTARTVVAPPPPVASTAIWSGVPRQICAFHEEALGRVGIVLEESQLPVEFKIEAGNDGWHNFSVTFDPSRVSSNRVTRLLNGAGALIIPMPAQ